MKIIKVPFSAGALGKNCGTKKAPDTIIKQLENIYANENGIICDFNIDKIKIEKNNIERTNKNIEKKVSELIENAIFLGGDHSITYSIVKSLKKKNKNFNLVILDAHPDLMKDFTTPTHESYLRELIEQKIIDPKKVIILGIRNWDIEEIKFLKLNNISFFSMKQIFKEGIFNIVKKLNLNTKIYLSIDIDVVDPVEAIGTGYSEHGGMSSRELIYIIQNLKKHNSIISSDIVEVNPAKDVNNITSSLAAKIISELC